jgi:hypothetical protein
MATSIKVKRSAVAGRIPATTDLELGEIAINTYDGVAYIKKNVNGTETVVNLGGTVELSQNLQNRYQYTATSNQTIFAAVYLAPFVDVFLNGVKLLAGVDYTATNGTTVVLASGVTAGSILDIIAYTTYTANANYADLNNSHIVNALGYTPYNATNPSSYITVAQARSGISVSGSLAYNSTTGVVSYTTPSTSGIAEGTNLYYTDARARAAVSAGTGLSYNSTTGVITNTITQYTDALARGAVSASGSLSYNSTTGVFSYTTPSTSGITEGTNLYYTDARARGAISASTGISYNSSTGAISSTITQYTDALARAAISVVGSGSYNSTTGVITVTGGVTSVNTRTGAITLSSSDVGLGNVENKSSATIRGEITSANVTTALGFTPYNATNPNGYITSSASISGNAATATLLANARNIQGVSFNGGADITVVTPGTGVTVTGTQVSIGQAVGTTSDVTFNNVVVSGSLTVNGTTTTINSTTLTVDDKNIELGSVSTPSDVTADGGGITLRGTTDKTFNWINATGYWTASHSISAPRLVSTVASGTSPLIVASNTVVTNLNADLLDGYDSSAFALAGHTHSYLTAESDTLATVTARGATTSAVITHGGLAMSTGTNVDQVYSVTDTLTLSTSWQDTSVNAAELSTGSYVVQVYVEDSGVGGGHYATYYTGMMSWFSGNTNEASADEIVLHRAGHASNSGILFLRVLRTFNADAADLKLQIAGNTANTGTSTYTFKFRRLI